MSPKATSAVLPRSPGHRPKTVVFRADEVMDHVNMSGGRTTRGRIGLGHRPRCAVAGLATKMSPTSLFDFMYRLRTRCDYRDVDAFLEGISSPTEAESFLNGLLTLVHGTLALLEGLIARHLKGDIYSQLAEDFCGRVGSPLVQALEQRRAAVAS